MATAVVAIAIASLGASQASAADKLTVLLDWFVNPDHAPLVVAKEAGYFARHNLDVELIAPADAASPPRLVAAGQVDVAVSYQPDLLLQVKEGLPLVRFGTLIGQPLSVLVALKDGPVKSLADLRGRTVGYSIAGFQEAYLARMLRSAGLAPSDVRTVNLNFNLVPALLARQVDAVVGAFRNVETVDIRRHGGEPLVFLPEDNGVPPYDELIYVTREALRGDPRLPRFLAAVKEATAAIAADPAAAWKVFAAAEPTLDDEPNRQSYALTASLFAADPGRLDRDRYDAFARFMREEGLVEAVPALDTYATELR
ncbi:MAG TPA: ABC transporter substrate-binding protein [Bauldia sp.]|nr:ABC transporter substrate-binding protein [Bauldia sp.]